MNRKLIDLPRFLIIVSMALVVSCGGGGGGGGGGDAEARYPTPKLPADAMKLDAGNADETGQTAMGFSSTFSQLPVLKADAAPSIPQIVDSALDQVIKWNRDTLPVAAKTEDLSADLCDSGKAIAESSETDSSSSGDIIFTKCDIGSGILLNGNFAFDASWNDTTQDYSFQTGGTLTITFGDDSVTVVMNLKETGNEGTGNFSTNIAFSVSGLPGGGFLVETDKRIKGNVFTNEVTSGRLIVYGAGKTRLRVTVTTPNAADVELDDGSGTFVPQGPITF